MSNLFQGMALGTWREGRESNVVDGGAPFYGTYECADGEYVALGAIEPQFYALLRRLAGLDDEDFAAQIDRTRWPRLREKVAAVIRTKTRAEWCALMEGSDACFAPVLAASEAPKHAHLAARGSFVEVDGVTQPAPAPRFSRTPSAIRRPRLETLEAAIAGWR
jgi:alpha-methylacyl-CoA racemase